MDACLFGATAARLAGCRLVTSRRDLGQIYPAWKLNRLTRVERQAAAVVVNARAIATVAGKAGVPENKIRLLPNFLDVAEFDRLSQESSPLPPPPSGVKRVVMVARLDPEKDPALLVRAAVALMAERSDFEVVIAGDGPERPALNQLVGSAGERIRFLGDVKAVPALLRTCQIGLLVPKSNEGLSNTLLEYMAAGLPMIATNCGGNRELVRPNETGILIPTGDQAALVGALRILLDDPERGIRLGEQARRDVAQVHDRGPVLDAFESLYREVANVGA
jgi:glycosyltransferase involved in cell wall biosynthesis